MAGELARVLRPGAHLLLGFQVGAGDRVDRTVASETAAATVTRLMSYRHDPNHVATCLSDVGVEVRSVTKRQPASDHEKTPQAFILAQRH